MATTSDVKVTPGTGANVATYDITEDAETKKLQRVVLSTNAGADIDFTATSPVKGDGTAGTPSTGVLTVQGIASMTALKVDGSGVTQPTTPLPTTPVSGAITTAMTGTASTSLLAAPGAGLRNYITCIVVSNSHATVGTDVVIQDGSGGTTLMTIPAAAVYGGAVITLPTPLKQPTANTALFCANVTTGASTKVSVVGYAAA